MRRKVTQTKRRKNVEWHPRGTSRAQNLRLAAELVGMAIWKRLAAWNLEPEPAIHVAMWSRKVYGTSL
jgi:hypothetical protein